MTLTTITKYPTHPSPIRQVLWAARVVDGLGFRYFHATADLTAENLTFKPSEEARTMGRNAQSYPGIDTHHTKIQY